jgi:hypothetical protein
MSGIIDRLTAWFFASTVAGVIDKVFVATYQVTYAQVIEFDPSVAESQFVCGVCTAIRTAAVTAAVTSLIWWAV